MGHSGALVWDTLIGHSCGTLLRDTLVGHSCGKLVRDTLVGHYIWDTLAGRSCRTLLWGTLIGHSCGTLLWDTPTRLSWDTLARHSIWDTLVRHSCRTLFPLRLPRRVTTMHENAHGATTRAQSLEAPAAGPQILRACAVEMHIDDVERHECTVNSSKLAGHARAEQRSKHSCFYFPLP